MADMFGVLKGYADDLDEWLSDSGTKKLLKKGLAAYDTVRQNEAQRQAAIVQAGNRGSSSSIRPSYAASESQAVESENPLAHEQVWRSRLATYIAAASGTEVKSSSPTDTSSLRSISLNFKG